MAKRRRERDYIFGHRITCNIFILYPLLTPSGALFAIVQDGLRKPFEATYGFAGCYSSYHCRTGNSKYTKKDYVSICPRVYQFTNNDDKETSLLQTIRQESFNRIHGIIWIYQRP